MVPRPAVFDTSIFVGRERRGLGSLNTWAPIVSVVTLAELLLGVEAAGAPDIRISRNATLAEARKGHIVAVADGGPIDVMAAWVRLRRELERKMPANDLWIAATALALGVPVLTQDDDYDAVKSIVEVVNL